MDEPAAWRELAALFKELWDSDGSHLNLYASWSSNPINDRGEHWFINGSNESVIESFKSAAERAVVLLGQPPGTATLFYWLDLLKKNSRRYVGGGWSGFPRGDDIVRTAETGSIADLCLAAAEYCYKLETAAIATLDPSAGRIEILSSNEKARVKARAHARAHEEIEFEKKLKELREAEQASILGSGSDAMPPDQNKRPESVIVLGSAKPQDEIPKNREARLRSFLAQKKKSIAAFRRAAGVYKANMQEWRRGELSDTSVMSQRIEDVLSGKRSLD